jgi:hypothetical protein
MTKFLSLRKDDAMEVDVAVLPVLAAVVAALAVLAVLDVLGTLCRTKSLSRRVKDLDNKK